MSLLIAFVTIVFIFIAFITNLTFGNTFNPFYNYVSLETYFILQYIVMFVLGFIILSFLFIRSLPFDKHYSRCKNYLLSFLQVIAACVVAFFLSYILLLLIACIELNILAVFININPTIVGVQTDSSNIVNNLKASHQPPEIIASDRDQHKELLAIAEATTGTDNFYGKYVLSSLPSFLITSIQHPHASIALIDNTLIITQSNPHDLQTISPILGYLLVQRYFPTIPIRSFPNLTIMSRQEYLTYRALDVSKKLIKIDQEIQQIEAKISSVSATIKHADNYLAANQTTVEEYKYYDTFFHIQRKVLQDQKQNIPHELGVFDPSNSIKIVLDTTSSHAIADYLETMTHEYLHYASYIKGKSLNNTFFEEGLTEYFARKTISDEVHTSTNLGYPVFAKIITEMTKLIPESDLANIYFTKDEANLEATLDRVYGDNFYENNYILFDSLQYASNNQQVLKLANAIMKKIGGSPLKEKDLISTYSNL